MKVDIGIITTENYLLNFKTIEKDIKEPCNFHYYFIKDIIDIKTLFEKHYNDVDAFVFSNDFIHILLKEQLEYIDKPFFIVPDDIGNIYKELLSIFLKNPKLDPSRVYIDFTTENADMDLKNIFPEDKMPYFLPLDLSKPFATTEIALKNHRKLWKENKIDLSITKFGIIADSLDREQLKYEYISPSYEHIESFLNTIAKKVKNKKILDNKVVVIFIELFHKKPSRDRSYELEMKNLKLLGGVEAFAKNNNYNFITNKITSGIEIITTIEDILKLTDGFNYSSLQDCLEEKLNESISIGAGTGKNFSQAEANASKALVHSKEYHKGLSVIVAADQSIRTLSGQDTINYTHKPNISIVNLSKKFNISDIYLQKIISYCEKTNKNKVYSKEIASLLGVTDRTANRTLNRIEESNEAIISIEQRHSSKGRPTKFYILSFIKENGQLEIK